jgi:hypothetical protein
MRGSPSPRLSIALADQIACLRAALPAEEPEIRQRRLATSCNCRGDDNINVLPLPGYGILIGPVNSQP